MRGLPFPTNAQFDRELSYPDHTSAHNLDDIPIDPALGGSAIDHDISTIAVEEVTESNVQMQQEYPGSWNQQYSPTQQDLRQYSQGPQGDPFAPPPPSFQLPPDPEQEARKSPPKPARKKRKPRREEECGFCQGNDEKNKEGESELMVTCDECARSGHPSCMGLGEVGDVVKSYPWKCIECKICEICHEKGDDERILFCDFCDRGWHMDCLQPPISESPPGRWHCPMCPPPDPDAVPYPDLSQQEVDSSEGSVASSSRLLDKGKGKALFTDDSDDEDEVAASVIQHAKAKKKRVKRQNDGVENPRPRKKTKLKVQTSSPHNSRMIVRLRLPARGRGRDREDDEPRKGIFDDILGEAERDTSRTTVEYGDKQRFEKSRLVAEERLAPPVPPPSHARSHNQRSPTPPIAGPSPLTRPLRSSGLSTQLFPADSPALSSPAPDSAPHQPTLRIRTVRFGEYDIQTWYDAPFPEEYANIPDGRLWICEFCLKYMKSRFGTGRHRMKCKARHPPGDEIYRDGSVSIFEVDGRKNKIYCQNLCLLSKMFLDHKSLFYDVEPFLFYIMTETDDAGARFVGYFSKEKRSPKDYNVSCIMTLPVRQRKGWGNLLIDFSYLLSKKEGRMGSPEKPLSGLGALGYRNYWTLALMRYLETAPPHPRLEDIAAVTSMTVEDICTTLTSLSMMTTRTPTPTLPRPSPGQSIKIKVARGSRGNRGGVARRHLQRSQSQPSLDGLHTAENGKAQSQPFVAPKEYEIQWDRDNVLTWLRSWEAKGYLRLKPEKLKWSPFLLARSGLGKSEAPREDDIVTTEPVTREGSVWNGVPGLNISPDAGPSASAAHALFMAEMEGTGGNSSPNPPHASSSVHDPSHPDAVESPADEFPNDSPTPARQPKNTGSRLASTPSTRRTRSASLRATEKDPGKTPEYHDTVAADEALAVKLALEERRTSRSLRSRPVSESPRVNSFTKSVSPRKRRRVVDSSPEIDPLPQPLPAMPSFNDSGNKVQSSAASNHSNEVSVSEQRYERKSDRLVNGNGKGPHHTHSVNVPSSHARIRHVKSIHSLATAPPVKTIVVNTEIMNHDELEVKSEGLDLGSPLTGLTSPRSEPSDDTTTMDVGLPPNGVGDVVHAKIVTRFQSS